MNNVLLPSGFDCSAEIGTLQKNPIKSLLGFQFFANDGVFSIFKDFFIISSSPLRPKSHLSHFLHPGGEPSLGSGLQNQDHDFVWEMGQSPGPGVLEPGTWLGHCSRIRALGASFQAAARWVSLLCKLNLTSEFNSPPAR